MTGVEPGRMLAPCGRMLGLSAYIAKTAKYAPPCDVCEESRAAVIC